MPGDDTKQQSMNRSNPILVESTLQHELPATMLHCLCVGNLQYTSVLLHLIHLLAEP